MKNINQLLILKRLLIFGLAGAISLSAAILVGSGEYRGLGIMVGAGICLMTVINNRFHLPILIMLSMMPGRGLLLAGLGYWDAVAMLVVVSVVIRQLTRKVNLLPMVGVGTWWLIVVFCGIFIGHVVANFFGAGTGSEGGFQTALVAFLAILTGYYILTEAIPFREMGRLPWLGIIPGVFEGSLEIANYLWAAAIPVTYVLYSNSLNWETLVAIQTGDEVTRLAGLRAMGVSLSLLCSVGIVYVPRLFSWRGVVIGVGLLFSLGLVFIAGYRSYVSAVFFSVALASVARNRLLFVMIVLLFVGLLGGLCAYNDQVAPLPLQIQRILCWLPGKWDPATMRSANVGFEWRNEVWSRFMHTTFPEHPWFGQGIRHFPTEAEGQSLSDTELFAVTQRTHSGFFSALDHVGIIGTIALILASLRAYWNCVVLLFSRRRQLRPWMVWVILYYASQQGWYWTTGDFRASFMPFTLCMCLLEVIRRKVDIQCGEHDRVDHNLIPVKVGLK